MGLSAAGPSRIQNGPPARSRNPAAGGLASVRGRFPPPIPDDRPGPSLPSNDHCVVLDMMMISLKTHIRHHCPGQRTNHWISESGSVAIRRLMMILDWQMGLSYARTSGMGRVG